MLSNTLGAAMNLILPLSLAQLALLSPGPDFVLIARQAARGGKRAAIDTACGISAGFAVHLSYCALGAGVWLERAPQLLGCAQLLGGTYLVSLGIRSIRNTQPTAAQNGPTDENGFFQGFFNNILNPKVALFLLALFASVTHPTTTPTEILTFSLALELQCLTSWVLLSLLLSHPNIRQTLLTLTRPLTFALIAFGTHLAHSGAQAILLN